MPVDVFWELMFLPLLLGGGFTFIHNSLGTGPGVSAALFSAMVCGIYVMSEGIPPLPPVSSKQKVPYILAVISIAALMINRMGTRMTVATTTIILLGGFSWLVQRQIFSGSVQIRWILPLLTALVFASAVHRQSEGKPSRFSWPVTLLIMMIVTSVVALLGGFIGVGKIMISVSVFVGGIVLVLFLATLRTSGPTIPTLPASALWALTTSFGIILILISSYATNLSNIAYLLILSIVCAPYARRFIAPRQLWTEPFLIAAIAAIPATTAVLLAILNF